MEYEKISGKKMKSVIYKDKGVVDYSPSLMDIPTPSKG
jgi:hypothetical protein